MHTAQIVIFDLDGTLVDAYPAIIASVNAVMEKLHYPPQDPHAIRRAVGRGDENLLKAFLKAKDLRQALFLYRRHHQKSLLDGSRLFPGALRVLAKLKNKGYRLAVASNRPTKFSRILIRHLKITPYFDYLLCADKLKHGKPHPEILKVIMRKFKALPQEAIYVGDMAIDAQAGRRAQVKTIIVTTGSSTKREIQQEKPFRIIGKIRDLLKIL